MPAPAMAPRAPVPPAGLDPQPSRPWSPAHGRHQPVRDWLRGLTFATLETSDCTHPRQSRGYRPSPSLRHLIEVRNPTCTAPGCRRPAAAATSTTSPPTTKAAKPANATSTRQQVITTHHGPGLSDLLIQLSATGSPYPRQKGCPAGVGVDAGTLALVPRRRVAPSASTLASAWVMSLTWRSRWACGGNAGQASPGAGNAGHAGSSGGCCGNHRLVPSLPRPLAMGRRSSCE